MGVDNEELEATRKLRRKKCEFCEGNEDISNKIFEDGSKFSDYMVKVCIEEIFNRKFLSVSPVEYSNGKRERKMIYHFNINYCPMCGKKVR